MTLRALSHITSQSKALELGTMLVLALACMPWLLALEAGKFIAVFTMKFLFTVVLALDGIITIECSAPKHVCIHINLPRKPKPFKSLVFHFTQYFFDLLIRKDPLFAYALNFFHVRISVKLA